MMQINKKYNFSNGCLPTDNNYKKIYSIENIIEMIEQLKKDNFIYIYDIDTKQRFVIEIYKGEYSFSIMNYYKNFTKDELIHYISQGFEIFKKIYNDPEAEGFIWEDDGGL